MAVVGMGPRALLNRTLQRRRSLGTDSNQLSPASPSDASHPHLIMTELQYHSSAAAPGQQLLQRSQLSSLTCFCLTPLPDGGSAQRPSAPREGPP